MSGYKRATVSISQDEYERLREAEQKLRDVPRANQEMEKRIARESQAFFQSTIKSLENRQSSLQHMLSGMSEYVQDLESATSQAMLAFEADAAAEMEKYAGSLGNYCDQLITNHAQQFEEVIASNHRYYQQELGTLARRVRRLAGNQEEKRFIAEEWLAAADQFAAFIRENYACQFFLPGRLERLEQQLVQVHQNLDYGLSEAVIAASQQLYLAFSDLRVDLERLQTEWQMVYLAVREAVEQEQALVDQSRFVQAVDLDGNPLDYLVNVEFWTQGRLTELQEALDTLCTQLEDTQQFPDTQTLSRWLSVDLSNIHQALEDIVLDARIAALNSQLRINIADLVVRALQDQGFALSNADYDASDMRLGYGMQLSNLEGSQVMVQVEPVGEVVGDNELQISSLDSSQRTEHELVQRWTEIGRSLSAYGLEVGQYIPSDNEQMIRKPVTQAPAPVKQTRRSRRQTG